MEQYKNKGISGLHNLGNTCYINSFVAVLSHTYELNNFLSEEKYKKKIKNIPESALLLEWDDLRKMLWAKNCTITPNKFLKTIQQVANLKDRVLFTGYSQNDLPEFVLFMIDCFHNSLSREIKISVLGEIENETDKIAVKCFEMIKKMYSSDYSEIWNMFYGVHVSEISSLKTEKTLMITPEPYFMIDLPIPGNNKSPSLLDCFELYMQDEILDGENAWFNEKTKKKEDIRKKIKFWSFPDILVIDFKRFNYKNQKNQILITFPIDLDLSSYVIGYKKNSYKYELYGVCNHSGGSMGGHYTSYVKNANNKWYHFNDRIVSEIRNSDVIVSPKAYCLFYRKKSII
jgi:ubiquitin carboxyl-terminal hydrolase 8